MPGFMTPPDSWAIVHNPTTATQATISRAATVAGMVHVCTGVTVSTAQAGTAQTPIHAHLRDGATGAGTILWSGMLGGIANTSASITLSGLNIPGTAGTAMTLEFEAAGVAASQQSVSLQGYTRSA